MGYLILKDCRFFKIRAVYIALLLFLPVSGLYARDITLTVIDAELGVPLEGAVVHTWDSRSISANDSGTAVLTVPDNAPVSVRITYPGYRAERLTITPASEQARWTVSLHNEGLMENRELVFTAEKQNEGTEVQAGRSVTIAGKTLARTSEIGMIEDVMTSVKLLPGVGYSGMFNARPSIRGGYPGDLIAVLDGFYVENPYYWNGGVSIFDPRMIQSVKLSHGIFSSRYGYTISGLLELVSKKPSETDTSIELGISSSSTNLNVSLPFPNESGGIMLMGRVTYWDAYFALLKGASSFVEGLEQVHAVERAPYIRTAAFSGNYRLNSNSELNFNGFVGGDGVGAVYNNTIELNGRDQQVNMKFIWNTLRGFLISGFTTTPHPKMAIKATLGAGFSQSYMDGAFDNYLNMSITPEARLRLETLGIDPADIEDNYILENHRVMGINHTTWTAQGRVDVDRELGGGFLFAAGAQEFYNRWTRNINMAGPTDLPLPAGITSFPGINTNPIPAGAYINMENSITIRGANQAFLSAAYTLFEYKSPFRKFGAELGLRADHLYFMGEDFSIQTMPSFNPRLNIDINLLRNYGVVNALDLTAGTGFFSSLTDDITALNREAGIKDFDLKQNRSWTSLLGFKTGFLSQFSFNIEGYYKYVFDRQYTLVITDTSGGNSAASKTEYHFDGEGHIWGFDIMLQRLESQFWDGWISYTFTYARYKNPWYVNSNREVVEGEWRFPNFHRYHNLNAVLNIKPSKRFNISTRLGVASGAPRSEAGDIEPYPVLIYRPNSKPYFIEKYKRSMAYSDILRDGFALQLDIKLLYYTFTKEGKTHGEVYIAAENLLSFLKTRVQNTSFDEYTGQEVQGSDTATYQVPVPMISFGFNWSY